MSLPSDKNFVPLTSSLEKDTHCCSGLIYMGYNCGLSVDSVNLKFTGKLRDRSVYGKIHINTHTFRVSTIYDRTLEKAEPISSPSGGDLTLCGPRHYVSAYASTAVYLELYEVVGGGGEKKRLFHRRAEMPHLHIGPNQTDIMPIVDGEATLCITMTGISPCAPTYIHVALYYPNSYHDWLVSGSVTALLNISGGKVKRRLSLFKRAEENPMRAAAEDSCSPAYPGKRHATIQLDRDMVLAPLWLEKSHILERNEFFLSVDNLRTGHDPTDDIANGVGCFLTLEVELKLVDSVEKGEYCLVRGSLYYQFEGRHPYGAVFSASVKGGAFFKHGDPRGQAKEFELPRLTKSAQISPHDVLIKDEDEIHFSLLVMPTANLSSTMDGEPNEYDMPFYVARMPHFKMWDESADEENRMSDGDGESDIGDEFEDEENEMPDIETKSKDDQPATGNQLPKPQPSSTC